MLPLEEIYCLINDFCKSFETAQKKTFLANPNRKRNRACSMSLSEIMTILVMFQFSHYRTFKDFYYSCLKKRYYKEFPRLVSYNRFIELMPMALMPLVVLQSALSGKATGQYVIDSSKLDVCHNLRIQSHKVFKDCAKRGKTSTGWFFGFKLHLIINQKGEIMRFTLTPGNTDDRQVVEKMTEGLQGWLFGDKGYISKKLVESLKQKGLELYTKAKKLMQKIVLAPAQKFLLSKRGIIETVIGQLKNMMHIQHTRHRSIMNFQVNVVAGLIAYTLKPKKPGVKFNELNGWCMVALTSN